MLGSVSGLKLVSNVLPILALIFVAAMLTHKLYITVRSRYSASVNCWFCNTNSRVPYPERNSWTCRRCEQYNGFTKDGDYNRDMSALQCNRSGKSDKNSSPSHSSGIGVCANALYPEVSAPSVQSNGLCDQCNEAQRLKVEKLAQFEPKHESRFEWEIKHYINELEKQFRLCGSCESHVKRVLREKKKMVLGSKFLNFIIKGAELLKQPHFNRLAKAQQQRKLRLFRQSMTLLTVVNIFCLLCGLPHTTREQFASILGGTLANPIFIGYSHFLAFVRVLLSYAGTALDYDATNKLLAYSRTFAKMLLYSLGLTQPQVQNATFSSCFVNIYPYVMLALSFLHNITDRLRFSRFTLLLVLWSIYANGSQFLLTAMNSVTFILLGSVLTLILLASNRSSSWALNESVSFQKLYAEDCFSDEESISILSEQLNCSNATNLNSSVQQQKQRGLKSSPTSAYPASCFDGVGMSEHASVLSLDALHLSESPLKTLRSPIYSRSSLDLRDPMTANNPPDCPSVRSTMVERPFRGENSFRWNCNEVEDAEQRRQRRMRVLDQRLRSRMHRPPVLMQSHFSSLGQETKRQEQQQQQRIHKEISAWLATTGPMFNGEGDNPKAAAGKDKLSRTSSQSSGFESQATPRMDTPAPQNLGFKPVASSGGVYGWSTQRHSMPTESGIKPGDLLRNWLTQQSKN
ncbi:uncharacterized protein LOC115633265 [Scaptodrosophila lebanonensis]|uniref:Uncharacterized protein LOC115633265 n=1 Tax=Drosophila lebanonensis TaxID=7225 RepID=A0A6J2UDT3_DROLE|nr:uncharacterized protein LOC115633265 [Scaptodrosophila lebanonensis]